MNVIAWLLSVIFSLACWGYSLYRVHTKFFNFITFFKSKNARNNYGELSDFSRIIVTAMILTLVFSLVPTLNVLTGLTMLGGSFIYPAGRKLMEFLIKVGKD